VISANLHDSLEVVQSFDFVSVRSHEFAKLEQRRFDESLGTKYRPRFATPKEAVKQDVNP
jgi:hypothetical protein